MIRTRQLMLPFATSEGTCHAENRSVCRGRSAGSPEQPLLARRVWTASGSLDFGPDRTSRPRPESSSSRHSPTTLPRSGSAWTSQLCRTRTSCWPSSPAPRRTRTPAALDATSLTRRRSPILSPEASCRASPVRTDPRGQYRGISAASRAPVAMSLRRRDHQLTARVPPRPARHIGSPTRTWARISGPATYAVTGEPLAGATVVPSHTTSPWPRWRPTVTPTRWGGKPLQPPLTDVAAHAEGGATPSAAA